MDFVKIGFQTMLESLVNVLNVMLDFMIDGMQVMYHIETQLNVERYFNNLQEYTTNLAYSVLFTFILVYVLKIYILDMNDMDVSEFTFRIFSALLAITITPILLSYIDSKVPEILNQMLSIISIETPKIETLDYDLIISFIPEMENMLLSTFIFIITISIICIIAWLIIFIQSTIYTVFLLFYRVIAPLTSLSNLSSHPQVYITFLKDVIRIHLIRIMQLVFIKVACVLILDAQMYLFKTMLSADGSTPPKTEGIFFQNVLALAMLVSLIFLPKLTEKYLVTSGNASLGLKGVIGGTIGMLKGM